MYIDVIIVVGLLLVSVIFYRRFSSFIYSFAIIDIFLRILAFLRNNLEVPIIRDFISKYLPESIPSIIAKYTNDLLYSILMWCVAIIYIIFLYYLTIYFIHKKK